MRKVLIISPHFPPTNAADMQRIRMLVPYLDEFGWKAEVLAVAPDQVASPQDTFLANILPNDLVIHRVNALGLSWSWIPGFGTLAFRAMRALRRAGKELLHSGNFDLIYFSTTQFSVHRLGPYFKKCFGIPFVMDYQDPWVNDYYRTHAEVVPPGGRLKYAVVNHLNRGFEPRVLKHCAGITSVSPEYPKQLFSRYSFLPVNWPVKVLPFPGDQRDYSQLQAVGVKQTIFNPNDGFFHWVYVGVAGKIMEQSVGGLFRAIASSSLREKVRLHFIGTSYAPEGEGKPSIMPIADQYGLTVLVQEITDRISYSEALACLQDADALIVPGSNDPGYTASKIYPYLLARRPLLTIFHENSSVVLLIESVGGAVSVSFSEKDSTEKIAERITMEWIESGSYDQLRPLSEMAFEPYTAKGSAAALCEFFDHVCTTQRVE